jgi:hypothetical protein
VLKKIVPFVLVMSAICSAQDMEQLKKTVAFVYGSFQQKDKDGKPVTLETPLGTAFFVVYPAAVGEQYGYIYIVTAKHVIRDGNGKYLDNIRLRLNKKDGSGVAFTTVPVTDKTGKLKWFDDPDDPNEDIAVIQATPSQTEADYKAIPISLFSSPESLKKSNVIEGDPVYLIGLMPQFTGVKRNYPVVRHGYISLLSDEPISMNDDVKEKVYALELGAWPGQSRSPVFLSLGGYRNGSMSLTESYSLLGIMLGYFQNKIPIEVNPTNTMRVGDDSNIGISFVLPAYEIMKVLNSKAVQEQRDANLKEFLKSKAGSAH